MQAVNGTYNNGNWQFANADIQPVKSANSFILVFADRHLLENGEIIHSLKQTLPDYTNIISASTSGEIINTTVADNSAVATLLSFDNTILHFAHGNADAHESSFLLGQNIAAQLPKDDLKYVLVISDGGKVNGTELINGINTTLGKQIPVTGGMAGDAARFEKTLVGFNESVAEGNVVLVGFYGNAIQVGYGLNGGWDVFGPERIITKSVHNVLYEIDDQNALALYKKYLGQYSAELPGSALLFPLALYIGADAKPVVRTILSIDEEKQTMTFAGDVPEGAAVRLMKANFDKLIYSAGHAAEKANEIMNHIPPQFVLLISCVGRKLVLGSRIQEEVEAVADIFTNAPIMAGFYSYGEFSPLQQSSGCELHNQTMTITTLAEI